MKIVVNLISFKKLYEKEIFFPKELTVNVWIHKCYDRIKAITFVGTEKNSSCGFDKSRFQENSLKLKNTKQNEPRLHMYFTKGHRSLVRNLNLTRWSE